MSARNLIHLLMLFSSLSLLSIGGGNTVLSEMHSKTVNSHDWVVTPAPQADQQLMTGQQFADIFAISQAAPGPSILIVTMIGYKAAGVLGAILATIAMMAPAGILVYLVTCVWQKAEKSPIRHAVEKGFAPLTVGLVLASAYIMSRAADHDWRAYILTGVCTLIFVFTKVNPLVAVAVAGLIGYLGWV